MVAQRTAQHPSNPARPGATAPTAPAATQPAPRPTPLLPVLALINGSALLALVVLVLRPTALGALQQMIMLLAMWLLVNLLVVVLVRMIDSGRTGTARVDVSHESASMSVTVESTPPSPGAGSSPTRMKTYVAPDPIRPKR